MGGLLFQGTRAVARGAVAWGFVGRRTDRLGGDLGQGEGDGVGRRAESAR